MTKLDFNQLRNQLGRLNLLHDIEFVEQYDSDYEDDDEGDDEGEES